MEDNMRETVYSRDTIEFVTVAVEYCAFLESFEGLSDNELTDRLTKLLPLLYLKAALVPDVVGENDGEIEIAVTEDDYNYIETKIAAVLAKDNDYLEVFMDGMQYSETPLLAHISENIADVYQDLRNFISIYEHGITENMNEALFVCMDNFKSYWGQKLTNVLRALHAIKYPMDATSAYDDEDVYGSNMEEEW